MIELYLNLYIGLYIAQLALSNYKKVVRKNQFYITT